MFDDLQPPRGVADLFTRIWQYAYVTTDLDRAIDELTGRLGLRRCVKVPNAAATLQVGAALRPWEANFAVGSSGGPIIEVIEPVSGEVEFYRRGLPRDGSYGLRFHHLATSIPAGDEEWARVQQMLAAAGLAIDYTVVVPGYVRAGYVDATARLGHFLEICQHEPAGIELFTDLSRGE